MGLRRFIVNHSNVLVLVQYTHGCVYWTRTRTCGKLLELTEQQGCSGVTCLWKRPQVSDPQQINPLLLRWNWFLRQLGPLGGVTSESICAQKRCFQVFCPAP